MKDCALSLIKSLNRTYTSQRIEINFMKTAESKLNGLKTNLMQKFPKLLRVRIYAGAFYFHFIYDSHQIRYLNHTNIKTLSSFSIESEFFCSFVKD